MKKNTPSRRFAAPQYHRDSPPTRRPAQSARPASGSAKSARSVSSQPYPPTASRSARSPRMSGVRIGDLQAHYASAQPPSYRSDSRAPRVKRQGYRGLLIVGMLLVVAVIVYLVLTFSGAFAITQVTAKGVEHLTATEVQELAAVPVGSTLITVDAAGITDRLKSNPWIEEAKVRRIFPDTLELTVTERPITAVVTITSIKDQQTENWAIGSNGIWLMKIPAEDSPEAASVSSQVYEDAATVLHIVDAPYGIDPQVGYTCNDESVLNAINIVSKLTTELADQVSTVSATNGANTLITLTNGVQIAFGTGDDVREKERVVLRLMEEHPGAISYINVRVVERPTWRALDP